MRSALAATGVPCRGLKKKFQEIAVVLVLTSSTGVGGIANPTPITTEGEMNEMEILEWMKCYEESGDLPDQVVTRLFNMALSFSPLVSALSVLSAEAQNSVEFDSWPELKSAVYGAHEALLNASKQ